MYQKLNRVEQILFDAGALLLLLFYVFSSGDHADGHPVSSRHLHPRNLRAGVSAIPFQIEVDANRRLSADAGFVWFVSAIGS